MKNIIVLVMLMLLFGVFPQQKIFATENTETTNDEGTVINEANNENEDFDPVLSSRVVVEDDQVLPETAGTITCTSKGTSIKVVIKGNLMIGLTSLLPPKMMRRLSLGKNGRACWGSSAWSACETQTLCFRDRNGRIECLPPTDIQVVFHNVPRMRFVPQIGGYGFFDLKQWKVIGCVREGCEDLCHAGEKCRPGPACMISSN